MIPLKPISPEAIPAALAKADRYRLLSQPRAAESICLDVLRAEPKNREALVMLLLCLTDQFGRSGYQSGVKGARDVLAHLGGDYERAYYEGVICERWGKSLLAGKAPVVKQAVDWLREAMNLFEKAQAFSPPGNDEAVLRWNACARLIMHLEQSDPDASEADSEAGFRDDVPSL